VKQVLGRGERGVAEIRPGLRTGKGGSGHGSILGKDESGDISFEVAYNVIDTATA